MNPNLFIFMLEKIIWREMALVPKIELDVFDPDSTILSRHLFFSNIFFLCKYLYNTSNDI